MVSVNITVGRKESYFSGDWFFDNEPLDYFVKSNGHKFSQYRFTFKKVNNNYQFVNIENVK